MKDENYKNQHSSQNESDSNSSDMEEDEEEEEMIPKLEEIKGIQDKKQIKEAMLIIGGDSETKDKFEQELATIRKEFKERKQLEKRKRDPEAIRVRMSNIKWKKDHTQLLEQLLEMFDFNFQVVTSHFTLAIK